MAAAAHNPEFAKKVGISQKVAKEFNAADKGKKFGVGGGVNQTQGGQGMVNRQQTRMGSIYGHKKEVPNISLNKYAGLKGGGMAKDMESKSETKKEMAMDKKQDVAMIKKAFKEHDAQEHKGGKGTKISLKKGGMAMKETMGPRTMAKDVEAGSNKLTKFGQSAVQKRGMTKGTNLGDSGPTVGITKGMKAGGKACTKMARGGGIESKGKTKGKFITMCGGGMSKGKK